METPLSAASEIAIGLLQSKTPIAFELAERFKESGYTLALVGGPVRDLLLQRLGNDLDFTTDAHPPAIKKILNSFADDVWDLGIRFGTVAAKKNEINIEI